MTTERTFSIIKPNAVAKDQIGAIYNRFEKAGLRIVAAKMVHLTEQQARGFYAEHADRPFFPELLASMTSGPVMLQVLEGADAVRRYRELMGATNPANALAGTLRADYSDSMTANAVHGSDSIESAAREIAYFFTPEEICARANIR